MKKRDIIIIVAVLAVALITIPVVRYLSSQRTTEQDYVYIYVGDVLYEADPLGEEKTVKIDQGDGVVNDVQISADGKVYMLDSTCDNQDCVYQGEMSAANIEERPMRNWIVCLPHQISIELRLANDEG